MSAQDGSALGGKKVLFFGTTDFDLEKQNATLERKFGGLIKDIEIFLISRGKGWGQEKYGIKFFLIPKMNKWLMPFWLFKACSRAKKLIEENKIDTIVAQSPSFDGFVASRLAKKTGAELIVEIHGDYIESLFFYYDFPKIVEIFLRKLFKFFGSRSLARADKIRVISNATDKLAKMYAKEQKIYRFPTFTDINIFKNETDLSWQPMIYYAGWLYKLKGLQFLIPAFQKLKDKYPEFKLKIVGDGPYRETLEKMAKEGGGNIEFFGWQPLEKVKNDMRNCWVYVLPSLSEGLGRVLIEAAMLRKPSIGTNVDGIPDIIQDGKNGFLFESGNIEELTEKLDKLMGNKELAIKMGEEGRKFVENKFSTEKYFEDYINMIND